MVGQDEAESQAGQPSSWCGSVTRVVLRHRVMFALASVALSAALATVAATRLSLQAGIEHMIDDAAKPELTVHDASLVAGGEIGIVVRGQVFSPTFLTRLRALQRDLESLRMPEAAPGGTSAFMFTRTRSLLDVRRITSEGDVLDMATLGDLLERGVPVLRRAALADRNIVGRFVDAAGTHALIVLNTQNLSDPEALEVNAALNEAVAKHQHSGFAIQTAGLPVLKAIVTTLLYDDAARLTLLAIALSLAVLIFTFKHPIGVVGPALVIVQTLATMFGAMALFDVPLTIVGLYLPGLVAVISIMDAIHIQSVYRSLCSQGLRGYPAIIKAAATAGAPMLYTAGTTCLGLLSLRVARLEAVRDLGTFGALGVAAAVVHTLITLPLVLSLHRGGTFGAPERSQPDWLDRALVRADAICHHARFARARIVVGLLVVALSAVGISRVQIRQDTLEWLPTGNALAPAIAALDDHLCGSASLTVLLDFGHPGAVQQPDTLARLARVEAAVRAYRDPVTREPVVKDVSSVLDLARSVWAATRDPAERSELPVDPMHASGVFDFLELFGPADLAEFATGAGQRTQVTVRRRWADADSSEQLIEHVRAVLQRELGTDVKHSFVGPMVVMNRAVSSVLHDLVSSFSVGILTIGLVFIAFLRSLRLGVLAMIPNVLPVGMTVGLMGLAGFPLDVHTMLLASVVLGIVDDDTFHFMHHFRSHYAETGDTEASVHASFAQTARSLVISSCTLALGFLTYLGANMHHMQRTAILLAFAVLSATITEFMLTPALLRRFVPSRARAIENSPDFKRDRAVAS